MARASAVRGTALEECSTEARELVVAPLRELALDGFDLVLEVLNPVPVVEVERNALLVKVDPDRGQVAPTGRLQLPS
jgi:hypothetical protein